MLASDYKLGAAFVLALLMVIIGSAESQILLPGTCPNYPTQAKFNPGAFITGTWYEVLRYPSPFEELSRCSSIDIRPSSSGFLRFSFKGINATDQSLITVLGRGYFAQGELSKLFIRLPIASWNQSSANLSFWVLSTDYSNYAVISSCDNLCEGYRREQAWILGRQRTLSESILADIDKQFVHNGPLKKESLIAVDQKGCDQPVFVKLALDSFPTNSLEKK